MPPKRIQYTLAEKAAIRAHYAQDPSLSQRALCQWFKAQSGKPIRQATISEILSDRFRSLDTDLTKQPKRVKVRDQAYPVLERILSAWFYRSERDLIISGEIVKEKARWFFKRIPEY